MASTCTLQQENYFKQLKLPFYGIEKKDIEEVIMICNTGNHTFRRTRLEKYELIAIFIVVCQCYSPEVRRLISCNSSNP